VSAAIAKSSLNSGQTSKKNNQETCRALASEYGVSTSGDRLFVGATLVTTNRAQALFMFDVAYGNAVGGLVATGETPLRSLFLKGRLLMSCKLQRQLRFEGLESRMLLAADIAVLADTSAPPPDGHDNIQACFADDVRQGGDYLAAGTVKSAHAQEDFWPDQIPLPTGFEAEGIELGKGQDFFVGGASWSVDSIYAGAIYKGNFRTGEGRILVQPTESPRTPLGGLSYDARTNYLYAATGNSESFGGPFWNQGVNVYDATSGALVEKLIFPNNDAGHTDGTNMVTNDVLVTNKGVYVTDSINARLYKIPLEKGGQLPSPPEVEVIQLTGFEMVSGFNANGLVGDFDGKELVVINMASGVLYQIDTESGVASTIQIQGAEELFADGDGLYMDGQTLYIMQNFSDKIAVVQLSGDLTQGTFVKNIVSDAFAIPTTIIGHGDSIYAVNSGFWDAVSGDPTLVQSQVLKVHK
jgi:hypothetical protein